MSRFMIYAVAFAASGVLVMFLWSDAPREPAGSARINQQTENGWTEYYSAWMPLTSYRAEPGAYIDWVVSATDDPAKSPFTIVLRRGPPSRDAFTVEATQPTALIVDGRRLSVRARRELVERDRRAWATMEFDGSRSDLEALASAKAAAIEFGGKQYELDELGLASSRELLRRTASGDH